MNATGSHEIVVYRRVRVVAIYWLNHWSAGEGGLAVAEHEVNGLDDVVWVLGQRKDVQRHPGVGERDGDVDRRAVAQVQAPGGLGGRVECSGQEDGAADCVEVEHGRQVRADLEALLAHPGGYGQAAPFGDGYGQGVDLGAQKHPGWSSHPRRCVRCAVEGLWGGGGDLELEALDGPA